MSIKTYLINSNEAFYTDEELSSVVSELADPGVLDYEKADNDLLVEAQAVPDMTVSVKAGGCLMTFLKNSVTWKVVLRNNLAANLTVTANSSGSNRVDAVVAHLKQNTPNALKNNVGELLLIVGTNGASAMTDGQLDIAVGDTNWYRLADITVPNGASSITNGDITDTREFVSIKQLVGLKPEIIRFTNQTSDPSALIEGDLWFNSTTHVFKWYDGTTTYAIITLDDVTALLAGLGLVIGGDGSDGAFSIGAGVTTTLNLGQVYNFSSIDINATGTLTFIGSGAALLNCSGNCAIAGTVELRNLITSFVTIRTSLGDTLNSGNPYTVWGNSVGGIVKINTGNAGDGGAGGTSTTASGSPGVGGAGGLSGNGNGVDGSDGDSSVGGGGGGGGGSNAGAGTVGATTVNNNGANGGNGANASTNNSGGCGGSGGGGLDTGNGGNGANGGNPAGSGSSHGGGGGNGGDGGANAGNGGSGGTGAIGGNNAADRPGQGGFGGDGYVNGGAGGNTGINTNGSTGSLIGGGGGYGFTGIGGAGGLGGGISGGVSGTGATGGSGGAGTTGGGGGTGGSASGTSNVKGGTGGAGGDAKSGAPCLNLVVAGNLTFSGTVEAVGGVGGVGGSGGTPLVATNRSGGDGGAGGDGSDGADVLMLCVGTLINSGTINNIGGAGGLGGAGNSSYSGSGSAGSAGADGEDGEDGLTTVVKITNI